MRFEPLTPTPKPTKAMIRRSIAAFEEKGFSSHSPVGMVGAHILNYCVANKIDFVLRYLAGGGYVIKRGRKRK